MHTHAERKSETRRPSLAPYADDVEVAERLVAQPCRKDDQIATLTSVPPQAWTMIPEFQFQLGTWFFSGGTGFSWTMT